MKKLFVIALATAALASCSKVEPIEPGYKSAIGFENAFIDNATKAGELKTNNIMSFEVWGTESKAPIFNATDVTRPHVDSLWRYEGAKYWHPDNHYEFAAIAPAGHGGAVALENTDVATIHMPISVGYTLAAGNIANQTDLLYATAKADTPNSLTTMADVAFTFKHLLSKVQFTFTNGHATGSNYNVIVENVAIAAKAQSTATLADPITWATPTGDVTLSFPTFKGGVAFGPGEVGVSDHQSLIIPNTGVAYTVTGTAKIYVGTTTLVETRAITGTIPAGSFASGVFYNVTATIASDKQIKFTVTEVTGWNNPATDVAM